MCGYHGQHSFPPMAGLAAPSARGLGACPLGTLPSVGSLGGMGRPWPSWKPHTSASVAGVGPHDPSWKPVPGVQALPLSQLHSRWMGCPHSLRSQLSPAPEGVRGQGQGRTWGVAVTCALRRGGEGPACFCSGCWHPWASLSPPPRVSPAGPVSGTARRPTPSSSPAPATLAAGLPGDRPQSRRCRGGGVQRVALAEVLKVGRKKPCLLGGDGPCAPRGPRDPSQRRQVAPSAAP